MECPQQQICVSSGRRCRLLEVSRPGGSVSVLEDGTFTSILLEIHYKATFWSTLMWTFKNFDIAQSGRSAAIFTTHKHILHYYSKNIEDNTFA